MPRPPMTRATMNVETSGAKAEPDRADEIEHANAQQRRFAPEPVGRPAANQRAHHGAVEGRSHGDAMRPGLVPKAPEWFFPRPR